MNYVRGLGFVCCTISATLALQGSQQWKAVLFIIFAVFVAAQFKVQE